MDHVRDIGGKDRKVIVAQIEVVGVDAIEVGQHFEPSLFFIRWIQSTKQSIHCDNTVSLHAERLRNRRTNESGGAGDQNFHEYTLSYPLTTASGLNTRDAVALSDRRAFSR